MPRSKAIVLLTAALSLSCVPAYSQDALSFTDEKNFAVAADTYTEIHGMNGLEAWATKRAFMNIYTTNRFQSNTSNTSSLFSHISTPGLWGCPGGPPCPTDKPK